MKSKVGKQKQYGFTIVEMIITTCIVAVLASVAISQMRDYTRRARISEVVLATTTCKNAVAESYPVRDTAPDPGSWGCETPNGGTQYSGPVQTSSDGVIRVQVQNLDGQVNSHYVYLVPAHSSGAAMTTPNDLGNSVSAWLCGSDYLLVRNALPSTCRVDMITYSSQDFQ